MKSFRVSGMIVYLLAFVIVVLLYFNYVYLPLDTKIGLLNVEHAQDAAQLNQYDLQLAQVDSVRENVAGLKEKLEKARENSGISPEDAGDDVENATRVSGIQVQSVTVSGVTEDDAGITSSEGQALSKVSISLSFQTGQAQLVRLLDYFESESKGAYYVDSLSYSDGGDGQMISLALTLYFFPQMEAVE